jgi:hypothetical protein
MGAGLCAWIFLEFALGLRTTRPAIGFYTGFLSGMIPLAALCLLLRAQSRASGAAPLAWTQSLRAGLHASFVAALLVYAFLLLYINFLNPGWMDDALDWKVAQLRSQDVPEQMVREEIVAFREMSSPLGLAGRVLVSPFATGGLLTVGLTCLLRRRPPSRPPAA